MKKRVIMKQATINRKYYFNLTNDGDNNTLFCMDNLHIKDNLIIDSYINDSNQLVLVTSQNIVTGYDKMEVLEDYEKRQYITPISLASDIYRPLTISIVNSMYHSNKSMNYISCNRIVNSHYQDDIINDLYQVCYMTLYENLKYYENMPINVMLSYDNIHDKLTSCKIWDNKQCDFITMNNCDTIYLACYRSISRYLYNNVRKLDDRQVVKVGTDNSGNDITMLANSTAYKEYSINSINGMDTITLSSFYDIIDGVKAQLCITEKTKVYNACCKLLDLLLQGFKLKDICKKLSLSDTTITKYYKKCKDTFYLVYKKPLTASGKDYKPIIDNNLVYVCKREKITTAYNYNYVTDSLIDKVNHYYHVKRQAMYNGLFGSKWDNASMTYKAIQDTSYVMPRRKVIIDYTGTLKAYNSDIIDKVNKYYHDKRQAMYNALFGAVNPFTGLYDKVFNYNNIDYTNHDRIDNRLLYIVNMIDTAINNGTFEYSDKYINEYNRVFNA